MTIFKKYFGLTAVFLLLSLALTGCGSSGGGGGNPYSGDFTVWAMVSGLEVDQGTCQIIQNGTEGSASFEARSFPAPLPASSVTFSGSNMTIVFPVTGGTYQFEGTWSSANAFTGTYSLIGATTFSFPMRLVRR